MLWSFGGAVAAAARRILIEPQSNSEGLGISTVEQHLEQEGGNSS